MLMVATKTPPVGPEPLRLHSFERWQIVRAKPNAEAVAKASLMREGFEVYYGERRRVMTVPIPANRISSKARHRRRSETREVVKTYPIYPGYQFVRRLFGEYDLSQCFELPGVIGLCCVGDRPATVEDYTVELLRLAEARGQFAYQEEVDDERTGRTKIVDRVMQLDSYSFSRAEKDIKIALRHRAAEEKAKKERVDDTLRPANIPPRTINYIDKSGNSFLYVEELGRITRIITSPDVLAIGRPREGGHAKCEA